MVHMPGKNKKNNKKDFNLQLYQPNNFPALQGDEQVTMLTGNCFGIQAFVIHRRVAVLETDWNILDPASALEHQVRGGNSSLSRMQCAI